MSEKYNVNKEYKHYSDLVVRVDLNVIDLTKPVEINCPKCDRSIRRSPLSKSFNCNECREYMPREIVRSRTREKIQKIVSGEEEQNSKIDKMSSSEYINYSDIVPNSKDKILTTIFQFDCECGSTWGKSALSSTFQCTSCKKRYSKDEIRKRMREKIIEYQKQEKRSTTLNEKISDLLALDEVTIDDLANLTLEEQEALDHALSDLKSEKYDFEGVIMPEEKESGIVPVYQSEQTSSSFFGTPELKEEMVQVGNQQVSISKLQALKSTLETTASMKTDITDIKEIAEELGLSSIVTSIVSLIEKNREKKELETLLLALEIENRGGSVTTTLGHVNSGPPAAFPG